MRKLLALVVVLLPAVALAQVPAKLAYQGRLLKSDGTPQAGTLAVTFTIYPASTGGTALWTETQNIGFTDGFYSTMLGDGQPIGAAVFDGTERFLELTIGGTPLTPRQRIDSVAYAIKAGGLAKSCATNEILKWNGTDWACATDAGGTSYSAATGGGLALNAGEFSLLRTCGNSEILKWTGTAWACAPDAGGVSYTAATGGGLELNSSAFSLLMGCGNSEILKWNGAAWACAADAGGTTYSGTAPISVAGSVISLTGCSVAGQVYQWNGSNWTCVTPSGHTGSGAAGQVTFWTGAAALSGSANLFWDNATTRLGVGVAAPATTLHVAGNNATLTVGPYAVGSVPGRVQATGSGAELAFARRELAAWPVAPAAGDRYVWYTQGTPGIARLFTDGYGDIMSATSAGNIGIGTTTPANRLQVHGAAAVTGTGTISASAGSTAIAGGGTLFTTELSVGDVIVAGGQTRTVVTASSATAATVSAPWVSDVLAVAYTIQKPAARFIGSNGAMAAIVYSPGAGFAADVAGQLRYGVSQTVVNARNINFAGLNPSNLDDVYEITLRGRVMIGGTATNKNVRLFPNGSAAGTFRNLAHRAWEENGTGGHDLNIRNEGGLTLGFTDWASDGDMFIKATLFAQSTYLPAPTGNRLRAVSLMSTHIYTNVTAGNNREMRVDHVGWWNDMATNITSLYIDFCNAATCGTFTGTVSLRTRQP